MTQLSSEKTFNSSFSLNKIQSSQQNQQILDEEDKIYSDKIKILELSFIIDKWEQELLFSDNGFFSLKGKDVLNKSQEFITELEKFINSKLADISFNYDKSKQAALELKRIKVENIKIQLFRHEKKELFEWETTVCNNAIQSAHDKAVLYKKDLLTVNNSIKNGLEIFNIIAEREKWKSKILKIKKEKFVSNCYYDIIKSLINDNDLDFITYYNTFKNNLINEQKDELEEETKKLKNNIIAYNWAIELFSYGLNDKENEKEIKNIKEHDIEIIVRKYLNILKNNEKNNDENTKRQKIQENWNKIKNLVKTQPEKAYLAIDNSEDSKIIKAQKEYIQIITEKGFIETDKSQFVDLLNKLLKNFSEFKKEQLTKYCHILNENDFSFFEKIQSQDEIEYFKTVSDYNFLMEKIKKIGVKSNEKIYNIILDYQLAIEDYKTLNSKTPDLNAKNKIIDLLVERNIQK